MRTNYSYRIFFSRNSVCAFTDIPRGGDSGGSVTYVGAMCQFYREHPGAQIIRTEIVSR